ncbi:hypothetical protein NEMBOFW57_008266 [Staphylotrichum longicolle]|uniref:Uncharacterized protein n=1 Tax=Staphylotrichum longicolle TaxID=669026 RepID=A0AAD4ERD1_9PEZI|nr:hypothetical protein NEMBOFW57_008266 [Staphylotrichum longicolle]
MANRLGVLQVQDALIAGAKAMASSAGFQKETAWLAVNGDRRLDRLKLGGIHRAQPFSHQWEEGRYHEYFIADWAHLELGDKVSEYERQRELRMALPDVKVGSGGEGGGDEGSDWGDDGYWTDDFAFWAFAYFDPYYEDGWDGSYSREETMTANDLALLASAADVGPEADNASSAGGSGGQTRRTSMSPIARVPCQP